MDDNVRWSESEDKRLAQMWLVQNKTQLEIADELQKSKSAITRRLKKLGFTGRQGDHGLYEATTGSPLDPAIKPVQVRLPARSARKHSKTSYSMLIWGDVHFPYQDPAAIDVLYQITNDLKPRVLVCVGDIFDFAALSDHREPELEEDTDFQTTLELGAQHLGMMMNLSEAEEGYFLQGNHEDRWDRMLLNARRDVRLRQILRIPAIRKSLTFSEVVGFNDLGYEYISYVSQTAGQHQAKVFNDRLVVVHGDKSNLWAARGMLDRYGTSVVFGHTHRIQNFTRRDLKGQEAAWNIGCLCLLDQHYTKFTDWGHAFAVVEWHQLDGKWFFNLEVIRIHDGVAIWRDHVYRAS